MGMDEAGAGSWFRFLSSSSAPSPSLLLVLIVADVLRPPAGPCCACRDFFRSWYTTQSRIAPSKSRPVPRPAPSPMARIFPSGPEDPGEAAIVTVAVIGVTVAGDGLSMDVTAGTMMREEVLLQHDGDVPQQ